MPRFSANISMLFAEHPFLERFQAARDAGFRAVEMQFPYSHDIDELRRAKDSAGVEIVVFNIPVGDMHDGGPGLAAMPGREVLFDQAVAEAKRYAEALRPLNVNTLTGWPTADLDRGECLEVLAANLARAAQSMDEIGVRVLTEAVNTRDRPGYFLHTTAQAVEAVTRAGHANLALEHDLYHMQIMEGDLLATVGRYLSHIGHIQFADVPGRHEPGTGGIDFQTLIPAIEALGYDGWMGAEYVPSGATLDSLAWMKEWT